MATTWAASFLHRKSPPLGCDGCCVYLASISDGAENADNSADADADADDDDNNDGDS